MRVSGGPRVIVVDDHPQVLVAAVSILSKSCDVVASLADGASAIDATLRLKPDVVVLDIAMPGLDGFQTCARIRSAGSDARIVFLSNHCGDDFVLEGLSRGATGFVGKSRMALDLIDAVVHVHNGRAFVPAASLLPRWRRPDGRRHDLHLHSTDDVLVEGMVEYLDSALECGDSVIAVPTSAHRHAIDRRLSARGHDLPTLRATGRYTSFDAEPVVEGVLQNGRVDRQRFIAALDPFVERAMGSAAGSPLRVSMVGELAPVLLSKGLSGAMLELERIGDEYIATRPVSALCGCAVDPHREEENDLVAALCELHSAIVPASPAR